MAFSLMVADEVGAVQDRKNSELALMERVLSSLAADHARSPEKDAIDFPEPIDSAVARRPLI
jgi:hypothetical protein